MSNSNSATSWVLEHEYTNFAWGYTHNYTLLFSDGRMARYSKKPNTQDLSFNDVLGNVEFYQNFTVKDDLSFVTNFTDYVQQNGVTLSESVHTSCDAGDNKFKLHVNNSTYEFYCCGDFTREPVASDDIKQIAKNIETLFVKQENLLRNYK
ncbi:MAG: hypothetical protein Terrestrivirus5_24 [Terrestrivirus sp.]|uniref:Uncharacterized protein n=1 Tax=Terrestrivirus sp. TaxID=2487775 RepID=A0A3G4ZMW8_9VIRU|nr:MAG: hypothetical protein Terrestrivirus5_24 [Terrestrivirus sp.]